MRLAGDLGAPRTVTESNAPNRAVDAHRDTDKPGAIVSGLGREHGDVSTLRPGTGRGVPDTPPADNRCPFPSSEIALPTRRREQTASRTLKFSRGEVGQDDPKRFPREPPGPPSPPGVAVIVNVSACSIEFTHSEFSFSVVVHPA